MTFRTMEVLDWIERECASHRASRTDYEDCCRLAAEVQGRNGDEKAACLSVRALLQRRYPKQEALPPD